MPSSIPIYPLRMSSELRLRVKAEAAKLGVSVNAYVSQALESHLPRAVPVLHAPVAEYRPKARRPVGQTQARNARCACGSGLKFKRCCGVA